MENDTCPKCGCREIRQGKQVAGGKMIPIDKVGMSFGSSVIADICPECGYIIEMKVEKPDIFK